MARVGYRVWGTLCAGLVALAGCAGGGSAEGELTAKVPLPEGIAACDEVFGEGKAIDPKTFGEACSKGEDMVVPRPVKLKCANQTTLVWNDYAWGYEGNEMTLIDPAAPIEEQVPYDEMLKCLGTEGATPTTAGQ